MTGQQPLDKKDEQLLQRLKNSYRVPSKFAEAIAKVKTFVLEELAGEIEQKQLYDRTYDHINRVQRRSNLIFEAMRRYWKASTTATDDLEPMKLLLDLCAIAHDAIQIFIPQTDSFTSRRREAGVSETLNIKKIFDYLQNLNHIKMLIN